MPRQLICTARHPKTSTKSLQDLCNRFWEKLFQRSRRKRLRQLRQVPNRLQPSSLLKQSASSKKQELILLLLKRSSKRARRARRPPLCQLLLLSLKQSRFWRKSSRTNRAQYRPPAPKMLVDKWLKKHQGQFRGKAAAFKKHVAEVCLIFKSSEAKRQDLADTAIKYGLQKSHASKMSFANLSTFIGACQFEAAWLPD